MRILVLAGVATFLASPSMAGEVVDKYGPFNLDGGKMGCNNPKGNEIWKTQVYEATGDRFFRNFSIRQISGKSYVGPAECTIVGVEQRKIPVKSGNFDLEVLVPYRYSVRAHADCGSGEARTAAHILAGDNINVECEISADLIKYQ